MNLDKFDHKILNILTIDGRITVTDLSLKIGLSKTPTQQRLKRLEKFGYIKGYQAILDCVKMGNGHIAFVEVKLTDTKIAALKAFNQAALKLHWIEEIHLIASSFDYLLKVRTTSIKEYREIMGEHISSLPHVAHTSTHVAMEAIKEDGI